VFSPIAEHPHDMLRLFSLKSPVTSGGALVSESTGIERNPGTSQGRGSSEAGDRDGHRQEGGEICMMCGLLDCTACADTLRRRFTAPAADRRPVTFGISTLGARAEHGGRCECCMAPQPMQQSLDEMEFERSLCGAAARGDVARAVLLLQSRQADPNVADAYGYFPLHYAARQGHADLCSNLLAANAAIGARAGEGMGTPLHRAVLSGSEKTVQVSSTPTESLSAHILLLLRPIMKASPSHCRFF